MEDAPNRAAHAALAMRRALQPAREGEGTAPALRIAIHVAQFLVGRDGGGDQLDEDTRRAAGATLEALLERAEPGAIVASESARPFLDRRFEIVEIGAGPGGERAFLLAGRGRGGLVARRATFVGRHHELEILRARLDTAARGQGQIVAITGDAGIGKSRLLIELRRSVGDRDVLHLEGHCLSYASGVPYLPVIDILRAACGIEETDRAEAVTRKVRAALATLDLDRPEVAPYLLHLLGSGEGAERVALLTPEVVKERTFDAIRETMLRLARRAPLVIAVEDLHWIDKISEEFLASLVEPLAGAAVLLVLTYRPGHRPPGLEKSYATQIALPPLAAADALSVVRAILPDREDWVVDILLANAEGNPFFLEELARAIREQGGGAPLLIPDTIQDVLLARIARLEPGDRRLLETAAVIGKSVPFRLAQAVADVPEEALRQGLSRLRAAEFLRDAPRGSEREYTFSHALTHEVVYESLPVGRRRALHARILEAIEWLYPDRLAEHAEALAHHGVRGEVWDRAIDYLRESGARAYATGSLMESLERYEQALALIPRLPRSPENVRRAIDVRLDLHAPLTALGQIPRLVQLHQEAERFARELDDTPRLGRAFYRMGLYSWIGARYREGLEYARQALDIATATGDAELRMVATYVSGVNRYSRGAYPLAIEHFTWIVDGAGADLSKRRRLGLILPPYIFACGWLSLSLSYTGNFPRALDYGARAVAAADDIEHPQAQAIAYTLRSIPFTYRGEFAEAVQWGERATQLSESRGLLLWLPGAYSGLGWALAWSGRAEEALGYLERGVTIFEGLGMQGQLAQQYVRWGDGLLLAGRLEEARAKADRAAEIARGTGEQGYEVEAVHLQARIAAAAEADREAVRQLYETVQVLASALGMRLYVAHAELGLGRLHARSGDRAAAAEHLGTAAAIFRDIGAPWWVARAEDTLRTGG
ncbi:MAG: AAA family ATPase [Candidatus Rokubacteria bacterium]|nr:AAA family ATPase [Candidatus Rokubacteria bacterium]